MRAFLALPLPDATISALVDVQARLPTGRPVPEDNLHLTLAYLGEVPEQALETLHDLLSATRLSAPEIGFGPLGTFAEMERGLVFIEVQTAPRLTALQEKVAQQARMAGIALPRRRFRPHVTLCRSNRQPKGPARDRLAGAMGLTPDIPGFLADRLCLYHSDLTPSGARHTVLASYDLAPSA
jgi:2'-5' RNA ligase